MKQQQDETAIKEMLLKRVRQTLDVAVEDVLPDTKVRNILDCDYDDLTAKAVRLILSHHFLGVIVKKDGIAINMLTAYELLHLAYMEVFDPNRDFLRVKVGDIVTQREFISVPLGTKLRTVLNLMLEKHVDIIPVLADGNVVGVCSTMDMMKWYRGTHNEIRTGTL